MGYECEHCEETFGTLSRLRLHDCPQDLTPDFADPFAPDPTSDRELVCLHCTATFPESAVTYKHRFDSALWWCPEAGCDGRGVGFDLVPADDDGEPTSSVTVSDSF